MVNVSPRPVLKPHPHLMVAFTGLEGDVQSLHQVLKVQVESTTRRSLLTSAVRRISPRALASLTSHILYGRRNSPYFVEPIVAGLERVWDEENEGGSIKLRPFLCTYDLIGAQSKSDAFVCAGIASSSLYGTAEALWRPGLRSEELAEVCGKAFLSALERDSMSGYGAMLYVMCKDRIIEIDLMCRND